MSHPHLIECGTVPTITDRILVEFQIPGFRPRFSKFPDELELEAPFLGEHNEVVLQNYLGYSSEQIDHLRHEGVLHSANY
jgi:crotonobetainyl-CoA:carnitine CoA-transferase CaiB-like acyl-CoA transferase